jgi:dihydrofolate reductase
VWSPEAFGFVEFQKSLDAVLMGRTTFEPAIGADLWPWPGAVELVYSVS